MCSDGGGVDQGSETRRCKNGKWNGFNVIMGIVLVLMETIMVCTSM